MIDYFAGHPTAANLLMAALIIAGLFAAPSLQRETFPRIESRNVEIVVPYAGARAEDSEGSICQRIEDAIDGIEDSSEVVCEAMENQARAVVEMVEGADLDRFTSDVRNEIDAIDEFPDLAESPIVKQLGRTDFVASVALTGAASKVDLKAYAEAVKKRMLRFGGIPNVVVKGFSTHQLRIEFKDAVLRQFSLSVADIAAKIQRQNLDLPAGNIQASDQELLIRFADERKSVSEFYDLVVVADARGGEIRLGDIATVTDQFELEEKKILFNGAPAAVLDITKTQSEDTLEVVAAIRAFIDLERQTAPPGIELTLTNDVSSIVEDRLNLLLVNGLQGLALVFVVLWAFFGFRYAFWVAAGLPVSFFGAVVLMVWVGYTINMLTMVGLLIVIGLLMDDAIVIAENIASQYQKKSDAVQAAIVGTRQVFPSVFASFITTSCIFGSLAFLQGDIGQVLRVVPVVMLFVLSVSLIEAFFILPHHLQHSLEAGQRRPGRLQTVVNQSVDRFGDSVIRPLADAAVKWRYLTIGIAVGMLLLAVSAIAGGLLKFSAFPELDGDVIEARILLPQGTPLSRTEAVVERLSDALNEIDRELTPLQPEGAALIKNVTIKYSENIDANEIGPHVATITVDLLGARMRVSTVDDVIAAWRDGAGEIADVISIKFTEPQVGPAGRAFDIRITGTDMHQLRGAADDLVVWLGEYRGTSNLTHDLRPGKPELRLRLKDGAATLGVDARMIADQLRWAFLGEKISDIQVGAEPYEVDVRLSAEDKDSLADLDNFTISGADGSQIPLIAVADIDFARGFSRIVRVDGQRTVTVRGDVDVKVANANEILADSQANFFEQLLETYPDVAVALQGQNKEAQTTQKSMISGFILGLIGVYLLLSFQFRSYVEPVVVMIIIPFAFAGAIAGHIALGLDFTMPSILGFAALAGVVVNDSILLVNFIKHYHGDTQSVAEAAPMASRARFRAVLLTSLTTIFGLLPLLLETSLQAQILTPLVTSLAFGLMATTLLVLFIVPAIYSVLDDFGLAKID